MHTQKNTRLFNEIYSEYYNAVLRYVTGKINDAETAEDLTQESFIKISKHIDSYDKGISKINTWVYTIVNRTIIDHFRTDKSGMTVKVEGYTNDEGNESFQFIDESNGGGIEQKELNRTIRRAIRTLNEKEQKIANLFFVQDKPYNEVSTILEIPLGSVKGTINRVRAKLQELLQTEYSML